MSGTVTRKKRLTGPNPSSSAASLSSSGTACSAASTMMKVSPRFCQTELSDTAKRADRGCVRLSQGTSLK